MQYLQILLTSRKPWWLHSTPSPHHSSPRTTSWLKVCLSYDLARIYVHIQKFMVQRVQDTGCPKMTFKFRKLKKYGPGEKSQKRLERTTKNTKVASIHDRFFPRMKLPISHQRVSSRNSLNAWVIICAIWYLVVANNAGLFFNGFWLNKAFFTFYNVRCGVV